LELRWEKKFAKEISWYVRTSPGILLVKTSKSITALDGATGQLLWELPEVKWSGLISSDKDEFPRGKNMMEVPGMGVLLLNRVMLPGDSDGRLIALNLMTGKRLWDQPQVDDLLTAMPLERTRDILLVSRQHETSAKRVALDVAVAAATSVATGLLTGGQAVISVLPSPYVSRFVFQRVDPVSGETRWNFEYPHKISPGPHGLSAIGRQLFITFDSEVFGAMNLDDGKATWEDVAIIPDSNNLPLRPPGTEDRLIQGWKNVIAVEPVTRQFRWELCDLGKITGISEFGGLLVAVGHSSVAAVDAQTGEERWRKKTYSHTTNLQWDKESDAILYADERGLHSVERTTGKSLLDTRIDGKFSPYYIRLSGPEAVVTIATDEVSAYNFKSGKKLFTEGKLFSFLRSYAFLDHWPMPDDGQDMMPATLKTPERGAWNGAQENTLLSGEFLERMVGYRTESEGLLDAYETESETGVDKVWWIDPGTNRQIGFHLTGKHHDVSRPLRMVFAVDQKLIWGAAIIPK
jgi:outer membrane protein assembly factor BamB